MAKETTANPLQDLKAALKSNAPARLYFFHGEERFLLQHYLQQLKKCILDELTESFNYHRFHSENFELHGFADAVENLPMMAERTLVQVDDIDIFKLSEDNREKMISVLGDIPDYCTVVFTFETVEWKPDKRLKKLWEAVSGGEIVEFAKQNQRDLIAWITRNFAAQKKTISPDLCAYLIDITDGTMTSLSGEIHKIAAYSGAEQICKADIDAVTEPVLDAVVFRMTDQLASGAFGEALQTLQKLLKMQQEPLAILGAIGGHFRRLSTARTLLDHDKPASELQKLCGLADYPARKAMDAARRFTGQYCAFALERIMETDYQMKTSFDDQQRLLELLILHLAKEARHD